MEFHTYPKPGNFSSTIPAESVSPENAGILLIICRIYRQRYRSIALMAEFAEKFWILANTLEFETQLSTDGGPFYRQNP